MKGFFDLFVLSSKELTGGKKARTALLNLCLTAMLIALSMAIEALTITTPFGKINFAFIPLSCIGMLFGPVVGCLSGAICDVLGFMVHPDGAFLPLYTLIGAFQGMMYGLILYRRWGHMYSDEEKAKFFGLSLTETALRIIGARLFDVLIINMIMNTTANMHYGFIPQKSLSVIISGRLLKNLAELAADMPLMLIILPLVLTLYSKTVFRSAPKATAANAIAVKDTDNISE